MQLDRVGIPNGTEHRESPKDFPKDVRIVSFKEIQDAVRTCGGVPVVAKVVRHLDPERKIRPGDVFESLRRMNSESREVLLHSLHQRMRDSLSVYTELCEFIETHGSDEGKLRFVDIARALGKTETSLREFVRETLGFTPSALGIPERKVGKNSAKRLARKNNINGEKDPSERLRQMYARVIRDLEKKHDRIDASTIAGGLNRESAYEISRETVELFLSQAANKDFIQRALRGEI